ncbi:MAG: hypothetical protein HPY45_02785 [Anaerolineae bacterium]|nr:hypothetical protein [Anaerolineae bacterium]
MSLPASFPPPKRTGLTFHISAILFVFALVILCLYFASQMSTGIVLILLLILSLALMAPLLLLLYRGYALLRGGYILEREGLRIRWGLRGEDIPLTEIEWVRPASDMGFDLPLPPFSLPGSIIGLREIEGLGEVEFMASDLVNMVLVATPQKIYAISPANTKAFFSVFQNVMELGSLSPLQPHSSLPIAFLQKVWADQTARKLILIGLALTILLFIVAGIVISLFQSVSIGYSPQGEPLPPMPSERLLLLPVLCTFTFIGDMLAGMFFYWRNPQAPLAYILWSSSILTPSLLIIAILLML